MARQTSPDEDKLNPARQDWENDMRQAMHTPGAPSEDEEHNIAKTRARNQEEAAARNAGATIAANSAARSELGDREENIDYQPGQQQPAGKSKNPLTSWLKRRWFIPAIISLVTGLAGLGFGGTALIPVFIKEVGTRWAEHFGLDTSSRRYVRYSKKYFNNEDCSAGKIKCRFKSGVTDKEIERFKQVGLDPKVGTTAGGKKYIISFTTTDLRGNKVTVTESNFRSQYRTNFKFRASMYQFSNVKALHWRGVNTVKLLVEKFKVNRKNPMGDSRDPKTIQEDMRRTVKGQNSELHVRPGGTEEAPTEDVAKEVEDLEGTLNEAAAENPDGIEADTDNLNLPTDNPGTLSTVIGGIFGGAKTVVMNVFGTLDKGCTIYQMIRLAVLGAKVYASIELVRYAAIFMTTPDAVKAGDGIIEHLAFMMGILITPSKLPGSLNKNAAHSNLFSMIMQGKIASVTGLAKYSGGTPNLSWMVRVNEFLSKAGISARVCHQVSKWYVQAGMLLGGIALTFLTAGTINVASLAANIPLSITSAMIAAYFMPRIIQMMTGSVAPIPGKAKGGGFDAGNAIHFGLEQMMKWTGLMAGGKFVKTSQAAQLAAEAEDENRRIAAAYNVGKSPFSLSSPDSIPNKLAMALMPYTFSGAGGSMQNVAMLAASPLQLIGGSASSLLGGQANAAALDNYGPEYCKDDDVRALKLIAGAGCSEITASLESEIHEPEVVDAYMVDNGHVDPETGQGRDGSEYNKYIETCKTGDGLLTADGYGIDVSENLDTSQCVSDDEKYRYFDDYFGYHGMAQSQQKEVDGTLGQYERDESGPTGAPDAPADPVGPTSLGWPIPKSLFDSGAVRMSACYPSYPSGGPHTGIDISTVGKTGITVVAPADGEVIKAENGGDAGNVMVIKHGEGLYTNYQHLSSFIVTSGAVKRGQAIARTGNTGRSSGPHLHFSVTKVPEVVGRTNPNMRSLTIDPLTMLPKDGRSLGPCG